MTTAVASGTRSTTLAWGSFVSGAYASAATALLFLFLDGIQGQPLLTASALGSVVLLGEAPGAATSFRLDMVALYSVVHLIAFVAVGLAATAAYQAWEWIRSPLVLGGLLTTSLTAGFLVANAVFYPGILEVVGLSGLLAGNMAAAAAMTWVLHAGLDPQTLHRSSS